MIRVAKPDNLIPKDSMVLLLKELVLVESYVQNEFNHVSKFYKTMKLSGDKILKTYNIEIDRFESSMDYYGSHQDEMQSIYAEILDSLNHQATMYATEAGIKDSISKNNEKSGFAKLKIK